MKLLYLRGGGRVNNVFAYDFLVSRSLTDQICVVATCMSNKQAFLLPGPGRLCCTCELRAEKDTFLERFPHHHVHSWRMFSKLTNSSFVPKAILQPHTGRQQLKLIVWAPSCLLQASTEDFGFPEVRFVFQRLAAYTQQVGATGPHSTPASIPTTPLERLYKGHSDLQISRATGYLPGCTLLSLSATLGH